MRFFIEVMGGEGCVLVIVLVTICVSGIYIGGVKGDDFFSFRF